MRDSWLAALVILGLGGIAIWYLTRPRTVAPSVPPVDKSLGNCGLSFAGVGTSVPCQTLVSGIKTLTNNTVGKTLATETHKAVDGVAPWEAVVFPVAVSHVAYNELKRLNPF